MRKIKLLFCVLIIACYSMPAWSADVAKIGIIDFERVLNESSAGKKAREEINQKGEDLKAKLEQMKKEVEELNLNMEREALVMSKDKRTEKQREIRIKVNDFKQKQREFEKEFKILEGKMVREIQKEVHDIAQIIGKEQGYLLILMKEAAGIIYSPEHINITDLVVERYNKKIAAQ